MNNKEMAADLAQYFRANGFEFVQLIDNDEKVVVKKFGDCRLQLEPKALKRKIRLCAYAGSNREKWKVFFKDHELLSNDVTNKNKDGDSGVVRESFIGFGDDWGKTKTYAYDECLKVSDSVKKLCPSCEDPHGKNGRGDLSDVSENVLGRGFQVYLKHKKLLDLIQVCKKHLPLQSENKKWTEEECEAAVVAFQEKAKSIDSGLGKYFDCNVFDILRMGEHEIRHSNMLAWLLDATETHGMGNVFLCAFLEEVVGAAKTAKGVCAKVAEMVDGHVFGELTDYKVFREDEHEDIKLMSESAKTIIVIENKWNAEAGENQLRKYRERTEVECKEYGADWKAIYVFLTKKGLRPSRKDDDDHWIPMSYLQIIKMVQALYEGMKEGFAQKIIVGQYLHVLKTADADLILEEDPVVQDVKKFCEGCDAIGFLPSVGEEYFQRVFDRMRLERRERQWVRDADLDTGKGSCIVFCSEELCRQLKKSEYEYCLELELDRTCSRVCCNLLRKIGGKEKREAVRWNCAKDQYGKPIQKTNVKNWKKFDIHSIVSARTLENMARNAIASAIEEVDSGVKKWGAEIVDKW